MNLWDIVYSLNSDHLHIHLEPPDRPTIYSADNTSVCIGDNYNGHLPILRYNITITNNILLSYSFYHEHDDSFQNKCIPIPTEATDIMSSNCAPLSVQAASINRAGSSPLSDTKNVTYKSGKYNKDLLHP